MFLFDSHINYFLQPIKPFSHYCFHTFVLSIKCAIWQCQRSSDAIFRFKFLAHFKLLWTAEYSKLWCGIYESVPAFIQAKQLVFFLSCFWICESLKTFVSNVHLQISEGLVMHHTMQQSCSLFNLREDV